MIKQLPPGLLGLLLLLIAVHTYAQKPLTDKDTIHRSLVSDSTWLESTEVTFKGSESFPWKGVANLPVDESFTAPVNVGQPYGYFTIDTIPGASVIKSGSGIHFYKTTFTLETGGVVTDCRIRINVDDDVEIYLNKILIAREETGTPTNYKDAPHDLMFYDFGPYYNPYLEHDLFDYVPTLNTNDFIRNGENELILVVRNKVNDAGGFTFRMDYSYVMNPEWVDMEENTLAEFSLYPNPTNGIFKVTFDKAGSTQNIKVFSPDGRHIFSSEGIAGKELELDLSAYAAGIYCIQLSSTLGVSTKRIIKQ